MIAIHDRDTFRALRRPEGRATRGPVSVAFVRPAGRPAAHGAPRVGFSVARTCGNAVVRNRIRRRFRAAVRESAATLPAGSYLVRGTAEAATVPFGSLVAAVHEAMAGAAARASRTTGTGAAAPSGAPGCR